MRGLCLGNLSVTAFIGMFPYLGSIAGMTWGMYLMLVATKDVHHLNEKTAFMVFGIIDFVLIVSNVTSEMRPADGHGIKNMGLVMKNIEQMEPEETDKMVGISQREPGFYIVDDRTGKNTFHGESKINQPFSCSPPHRIRVLREWLQLVVQ